MKEYCYVIVNNAGHSWGPMGLSDEQPHDDQKTPVLMQLLQDGWVPVRETPMGGGTSPLAHSLILLEKGNTPQPTRGRRGRRSATQA